MLAGPSRSYVLFATLVALTVLIGVGAYIVVENDVNIVVQAYEGRHSLTILLADVIDQETALRGFAATKQALFLQPYDEGRARYRAHVRRALEALQDPDFAAIVVDVHAFDATHSVWISSVVVPIVRDPARPDADLLELRGKSLVDAMRARIAHGTAIGTDAINQAVVRTRYAVVLSIASIVLLTLVLGTAAIRGERKATREEARLRAEIADRNRDLERSNSSLEEFAYVASHDLQEPLRTVASFTQLLQKRYAGRLDADADEFIGFAVDGATRMQQLIADILQYSRVTTHGKPLVAVNLGDCVARATQNLQMTIAERNAQIDVGQLPVVLGDGPQLMQLFQNLIGNSIKYNENPNPRVRVTAQREGQEWVVAVADNGIGIAPGYHERIFRIFSRLHTRGEYSGTGIGLALCKRIVERHAGRIWVESVEGSGAVFSFTLQPAEKGTR